jgi:hypothetical protein
MAANLRTSVDTTKSWIELKLKKLIVRSGFRLRITTNWNDPLLFRENKRRLFNDGFGRKFIGNRDP